MINDIRAKIVLWNWITTIQLHIHYSPSFYPNRDVLLEMKTRYNANDDHTADNCQFGSDEEHQSMASIRLVKQHTVMPPHSSECCV